MDVVDGQDVGVQQLVVGAALEELVEHVDGSVGGVQLVDGGLLLSQRHETRLAELARCKVGLDGQTLAEEFKRDRHYGCQTHARHDFLHVLSRVVIVERGEKVMETREIDHRHDVVEAVEELLCRAVVEWMLGRARKLVDGLHGETDIRVACGRVLLPRLLD